MRCSQRKPLLHATQLLRHEISKRNRSCKKINEKICGWPGRSCSITRYIFIYFPVPFDFPLPLFSKRETFATFLYIFSSFHFILIVVLGDPAAKDELEALIQQQREKTGEVLAAATDSARGPQTQANTEAATKANKYAFVLFICFYFPAFLPPPLLFILTFVFLHKIL